MNHEFKPYITNRTRCIVCGELEGHLDHVDASMNPEITQADKVKRPVRRHRFGYLSQNMQPDVYFVDEADPIFEALEAETESLRRKCGEKDALIERINRVVGVSYRLECTLRSERDAAELGLVDAKAGESMQAGRLWEKYKTSDKFADMTFSGWLNWNVSELASLRASGEKSYLSVTELAARHSNLAEYLKQIEDSVRSDKHKFWPCREGTHGDCAQSKRVECACACHKVALPSAPTDKEPQ